MHQRRGGISAPSAARYGQPDKSDVASITIPIDGLEQYIPSDEDLKKNPIIGEEFSQFWGIALINAFARLNSKRTVGKIPIFISILKAALDTPSCNGRTIEYQVPLGEKRPDIISASLKQGALVTISNIYKTMPVFRGASDYINPFQYVNWLFARVAVTVEIGAKYLGSFFSQAPYQLFKIAGDKNYSPVTRFFAGVGGVLAVPTVWLVGQVFFTLGNLASYSRRFLDGFANLISGGIAFLGDKINGTNNYGETYPRANVSLKAMVKSAVLSLGGGIPILSGLINRFIVMPVERALAIRRKVRNAYAVQAKAKQPSSSTARQMKVMNSNQNKPAVSLANVRVNVSQKVFDPKKLVTDNQYYHAMLSRFKRPAIEEMLAFYEMNKSKFNAYTRGINVPEKFTQNAKFLEQPANAKAEQEFRKFLQENRLTETSAFSSSPYTSNLMVKLNALVDEFKKDPTEAGYQAFCREGAKVVTGAGDIKLTGFPVLSDMILNPEKYNNKTMEEKRVLIEANHQCLSQDKNKCGGFLDVVHLVSTVPASGEFSRILRKPIYMETLQGVVDLNLYLKLSKMNKDGLFNHPVDIDELSQRLGQQPFNLRLTADELNQIKEQAEYRSLLNKIIVDNIDRECHIEGNAVREKISAINNFVANCNYANPDAEKAELKNLLVAINIDTVNLDQIYSALKHQHQPAVELAAPINVPSVAAPAHVELNAQEVAEFKQLQGKHAAILHLMAMEVQRGASIDNNHYPRIFNLVLEASKRIEKLPQTDPVIKLNERYKELSDNLNNKLKPNSAKEQVKQNRLEGHVLPALRMRGNNGG